MVFTVKEYEAPARGEMTAIRGRRKGGGDVCVCGWGGGGGGGGGTTRPCSPMLAMAVRCFVVVAVEVVVPVCCSTAIGAWLCARLHQGLCMSSRRGCEGARQPCAVAAYTTGGPTC